MIHVVHSCALIGLEPYEVLCEVDLVAQLPAFALVGLPSSVTQESRERVRAAVANSGFDWPARKVTINLLPANLPKWGSHFELAMAIGVINAQSKDEMPPALQVFAVGELSLSGQIRPCGWLSAIAPWLNGYAGRMRVDGGEPLLVIVHEDDLRQLIEASPALKENCEFAGVDSLRAATEAVRRAAARMALPANPAAVAGSMRSARKTVVSDVDFINKNNLFNLDLLKKVRNEPLGAIAALTAIAGEHHCLFAGPHGMGKSMLVRAICEGSPPLAPERHALRTGLLRTFGHHFGASGAEEANSIRPVVRLQSSATRAALEGSLLSSGQVLPGEFTRAHLGILVADELLEFKRDVIESFRQPLDEGILRLQRAKFKTLLPAAFQFLASTNLCPCGSWGRSQSQCRCPRLKREAYQLKLSGPLMDRFDLIVMVGNRGKMVYPPEVPADLISLVADLSDPASWEQRLKDCHNQATSVEDSADPAGLWSDISCEASDRGRLKLARVSKTLAKLLREKRSSRHLRLAMLVRQNLPQALARSCDTRFSINNNSFRPLANI